MVHIPTKLHQFLISSFRDFVQTDTQADRCRQKQYLHAACLQLTMLNGRYTPTSFSCKSPVKVQQDVCKASELMHRLFLFDTNAVAVAIIGQAPDDEVTVTVA